MIFLKVVFRAKAHKKNKFKIEFTLFAHLLIKA